MNTGYCHEVPRACPYCHFYSGYRVGSFGSNPPQTDQLIYLVCPRRLTLFRENPRVTGPRCGGPARTQSFANPAPDPGCIGMLAPFAGTSRLLFGSQAPETSSSGTGNSE